MANLKPLTRLPIFPFLVGLSLAVGWLIPAFYDWTGSDQGRPSPLVSQAAIGLILFGLIVCAALPWLPIAPDSPANERIGTLRFGLRTILLMTAVIAMFLTAFITLPRLAVSSVLYGIALGYAVRFWILFRLFRWRVAALLGCMYFPFAWLVTFDERSTLLPAILWIAPGLPAFVPTLLVGTVAHQNSRELAWLLTLLASAELVVGVWIIRLGPRRAIAYLLFLLITSIFGSFALNALVRI